MNVKLINNIVTAPINQVDTSIHIVNNKTYTGEKFHSLLNFIVTAKENCGFGFDKNENKFSAKLFINTQLFVL